MLFIPNKILNPIFKRLFSNSETPLKILVALSGGVDSSVAAYLLKKQGYSIEGVYVKSWDPTDSDSICTSDNDYKDAQKVARKLEIKLHYCSLVKPYWNLVFEPLIRSYRSGLTPNPDILCNKKIKFDRLLKYSKNKGFDYLATGHFAQILDNDDNTKSILAARDRKRDQSYFLSSLDGSLLHNVLFPIGHLMKEEVRLPSLVVFHYWKIRNIAREAELHNAEKKSSTGICFVGKKNFQSFVASDWLDIPYEKGTFQTLDGTILGYHNGYFLYTIGQNSRLSGMNEKYVIVDKNIEKNILYVAAKSEKLLLTQEIKIHQVNWISGKPPTKLNDFDSSHFMYEAQTHYPCETLERCNIQLNRKSNEYTIFFENPINAVAPGQQIVIYDGNVCLGGGSVVMQSQKNSS